MNTTDPHPPCPCCAAITCCPHWAQLRRHSDFPLPLMRLPFRLCPTPRIRLRRETFSPPPAARRATEPACHRPSCRRVPVLASAVRQRLARPDAFVPHTASALRTKRAENIVLRAEDGEFCRCPPVFHPICQPSPCRGSPSEWGVRQVFRNSFRIRELVTPIRLSQRYAPPEWGDNSRSTMPR